MWVSRSEVSARDSIHRDSDAIGAKAISASSVGRGAAAGALRTKRSFVGPGASPGSIGSHTAAGATAGSSATFRGPVRRS